MKKIKTKHIMILILITLLTLSMAHATETNQTNTPNQTTTPEQITTPTEDNTKNTHNIKESKDLENILNKTNTIKGKHTIELNTPNTIIQEETYIDNPDMELVFQGNGNQLTLKKDIFLQNTKVTFNNITLDLDGGIRNSADMYLNNVTIKNTKGYQDLQKTFNEKQLHEFNESYMVEKTFNESKTYSMSIQNDNKYM